ncbi:MAG TPA: hypothetical protein ENK80_01215 [Rhodobacterales bacterium]|nr:hypothetical protein [Rhodobacterales bacterium]
MVQGRTIFRGALLVAVIAVSGCLNTAGGGGGHLKHAAPQVRVMSNSFTISGPRGFCIDPGATRDKAGAAFAVLGSCAVISGNPKDSKPRKPAMLTASVTPTPVPLDSTALDRMAAFFSTPEGRGALARADNAQEVSVIDMAREEGLLVVHAEDGDRAGDVTPDYWRGIFEAGGKLVTVTVSGFRAAPLDDKTGARLTRDFIASLQKANPGPSGKGAEIVAGTGGDLVSATADRLASFFNRLP